MTGDIVALSDQHAAEVIELWEAAGLTRPWNPAADDYTRAVEGPTSDVLGVHDGGVLVGTVMVGHDGHRGWVYYLAVRDSHRGAGMGKALMRAAEEWLRLRGGVKLQLMVRTENRVVHDFYRAIGYEPQDVTVLGRRLDDA
ncbi:GNAT family acetyltransferase [uncultured Agrococcus sp.]|uniref:GNAT family acetyltransferase n=1 Tax=uncultured Agrococcus sp. TaxID=382258 RepID=UPI0025F2B5C7|nr:GNAT family acetyltransferase [uncultured Agrococcus sp.]